jgi:formylmethanofuran dehydrogenase subunit D
MPAKKQKQPLNYNSDTVTIDSSYGSVSNTVTLDTNYGTVPNTTNIGSSMGTDTITLNNTLWSGNSITSPYTISTGTPTFRYTNGTGDGTYNWNNTITSTNTKVQINGDGLVMQEGADIVIGGKSLTKAIEQIEERLGILHPNPALEERWDKLKELRQQYIEMEKDLLEKEKLMKILKEA